MSPEYESLFSHTATLIARRIPRFNPSTNDLRDLWVALSAEVSDRIPTTLTERGNNLRRGFQIKSLNSFLLSKKAATLPIAVTGVPGSGKTFELVKLYCDLWRRFRSDRDPLPILIFANEIATNQFQALDPQKPLYDFLVRYLQTAHYPQQAIDIVKYRFNSLRLVFLFDALDEIPDKQEYTRAVRTITRELVPSVQQRNWRFILTCRTEDYDPTLQLFELEIQPLSPEQIDRFYRKKASAFGTSRLKRQERAWLRLKLSDMRWFEPFVTNPYFLSLMLDSLENSFIEKTPAPLNLQRLFRDTIDRELEKPRREVEKPAHGLSLLGKGLTASFETACSVLSIILLEKTLRRDEAVFTPSSESDVRLLASYCAELRDRAPLFTLISKLSYGDSEEREMSKLTLSNALDDKMAHEVLQLITAQQDGPDRLTLFLSRISPDERMALSCAAKLSPQQPELPDSGLVACIFVTLRLLRLGVERRLLRDRSEPQWAIVGFRHRRLLEYFAASYLGATQKLLSEKIDNLWYKQTLLLLGGIQGEPAWLLNAIGRHEFPRLLLAAEVIRFLHPASVTRIPKEIEDTVVALCESIFSSGSSSNRLQAFESLSRLLEAHPRATPDTLTLRIARLASSAVFYRHSLRLFLILEREGRLTGRCYFRFAIDGFRNLMTIPLE